MRFTLILLISIGYCSLDELDSETEDISHLFVSDVSELIQHMNKQKAAHTFREMAYIRKRDEMLWEIVKRKLIPHNETQGGYIGRCQGLRVL